MNYRTPVYICAAKRTPIGSLAGALASVPAPELAAQVIRSIVTESKISPAAIEQLILGCVLTAGLGQAPARQAVFRSGLPKEVGAFAVNKVCSSGLKAVQLGANEIALGAASVLLAGGMENMSSAPYIVPGLRSGVRLGHAQAEDSIIKDGLWDVPNNFHMGIAAEMCAKKFTLSREEQDAHAVESYRRAQEAIEHGYFRSEIVPVKISSAKGETEISVDEEPSKLKLEKVPSLKPVFDKNGTVTAANASSINDGASVLLLCSEEALSHHTLTPIARLVSYGTISREPEWFTLAPIGAVERALQAANKRGDDIDLFEINEAFSAVSLACQRGLDIPSEKLNVSGGAVALGHPIGASGARIIATLVHNLARLNKKLGVAAICNGGGEGTALVIERC